MEFSCSVCKYVSFYKSNINNHINKNKKCGDNPIIIERKVEIKCKYCNKNYKTRPPAHPGPVAQETFIFRLINRI